VLSGLTSVQSWIEEDGVPTSPEEGHASPEEGELASPDREREDGEPTNSQEESELPGMPYPSLEAKQLNTADGME